GRLGQLCRRVEGKLRRLRRTVPCLTQTSRSAVELGHSPVQPARGDLDPTRCTDWTLCRQTLCGLDAAGEGIDRGGRGFEGPPRAAEGTSPGPAPVPIRSA